MPQFRTTAERTRSRRWRSGTRRNKKYPITHLKLCPEPNVCLIHMHRVIPPARPMRLTACEQRWVNDLRSGRVHVHLIGPTKRQAALLAKRQHINTKRFKASGIVNGCDYGPGVSEYIGDHLHLSGGYHSPTGRLPTPSPRTQPVKPSQAVSDAAQVRMDERHADMRAHISEAIMRSSQAVVEARQRLDISDRWYPRG